MNFIFSTSCLLVILFRPFANDVPELTGNEFRPPKFITADGKQDESLETITYIEGILCRLPKSVGYECSSNRPTPAFYFDSTIQQCIKYIFLGCGGNPNRFTTKLQCEQGCQLMTKCGKGLPLMDFAGYIKRCDRQAVRCFDGYECIGKGMQSVCCRRADRICALPVGGGTMCGIASMTRYYFDINANLCRPFSFVGCGGNENDFRTKGHCFRFCANSGEYSGNTEVYLNPLSKQPQLCDSKQKHGCPITFECIRSTEYASICCKTQPICSSAESLALFITHTSEPTRCNSKEVGACPGGYTYQQAKNLLPLSPLQISELLELLSVVDSADSSFVLLHHAMRMEKEHFVFMKESICCTPPLEYPFGMRALRGQFGRPHICSIGVEGTCPVDHICTWSSSNPSIFLCCRPQLRFVDASTRKTLQCYRGENGCGPSTNCLVAIHGSEDVSIARYLKFCCCHRVDMFTCADGRMPRLESSSSKPLRCNVSNRRACPEEHACEELIDGTTACCSNPVINRLNCTEAILFNGVPRQCVGWDDNSCNSGKCRKASNSKYYCCKAESL